jgi:hypothetical protein
MKAGSGCLIGIGWGLFLLVAPPAVQGDSPGARCAACHAREVAGYSQSAMAHALRRPAREAEGAFVHAASNPRFVIHSDPEGIWQRMERDGDASNCRLDYVIGSGAHKYEYLVRIGTHLFQSPICFYARLGRYDLAPGAEHAGGRGPGLDEGP